MRFNQAFAEWQINEFCAPSAAAFRWKLMLSLVIQHAILFVLCDYPQTWQM